MAELISYVQKIKNSNLSEADPVTAVRRGGPCRDAREGRCQNINHGSLCAGDGIINDCTLYLCFSAFSKFL